MDNIANKALHSESKIIAFTSLERDVQALLNEASAARELSYSPYSKFPVGAAVRSSNGTIFTGCNVENASYGLSICAERTALVKAISVGTKTFHSIAVVANLENNPNFVAPCGACRQFIAEFGTGIIIYLSKPDLKDVQITTAAELLPFSFHF